MKPILITVDGNIREVAPENGSDFSLKELYRHIGCDMIQIVTLNDGRYMILDEEGKLKDDFKVNHVATAMYQVDRTEMTDEQLRDYYKKKLGVEEINVIRMDEDMPGALRDVIVGNVVVCEAKMLK